ncbi:hypothetical protein AaE_007092 [Aphanomyces astaci]|uniref:GAF domain-containing protein n=1 Tax=Aphanomyces astaci TaxID=112090 RepID=A0A6A5AIE5_APHAT|nr:hypothetical protein AaE_007092 [Aphanomyces astaci]
MDWSQSVASPRKVVSATVQMSPAEQRELETLRLKVHALESEKKDRNADFAVQTKTFQRRIKKLQQELRDRDDIVMGKDAQINVLQIRSLHQVPLLQGIHPTPRMLTDEMWLSVPPLKTHIESSNVAKSNVGGAFDALVSKKFMDSIRKLPGHYHEAWLTELQETATKLSLLHTGLKAMCGVFHRLASCCDLYDMVRLISAEACALANAEEAFVFVVDPVQKQEFWSRICRADGETITARSNIPHISLDQQTAYNEYLAKQPHHVAHDVPIRLSNDHSNHHPQHNVRTHPTMLIFVCIILVYIAHNYEFVGVGRQRREPAPGFASYVYHTKEVLNIPGCKLFGHPLYSGGHMNSDRFIKLKSSSTMLLPICDGDDREPLAVLQVCGKTQHFCGMGVTVTVENCLSFTQEDEYLLSGLANFCSGLLAKVMTFTEVERTRKSETVLLTLSRQIFTCLDFPKLSMLVMQSTKELLDAGHEVVVHMGQGIAGACAETRRLINVPDAYEDKRFNRVRSSAWDDKTKYRTKSILAMPIISSKDSLLGVIQMINKSGGTAFKAKDEEHIAMVSQLIALAMENNNLFQKTQVRSRHATV